MPNNQTDITEFLKETFTAHGLNDEKLSYLTNIPKRFITALRTGDFSRLPAEPYTRGYLIKISSVLKIDSAELINIYRESIGKKRRGGDKLPVNRFKATPLKKSWLLGTAITLIIAGLLFFRLDAILGMPELSIVVPAETSIESLTVEGQIKPRDTLTLNGEIVYTDDVGYFKHDVLLQPGINTLDLRVKRFLGRETEVVRTVYYNPAPANITNQEKQ